jgi:4-amino-4-deoxy-L-arabinose transferase-like glycosyltransferase
VVADTRPPRSVSSAASVRTWTLGADTVVAFAVVLGSIFRIVQYAADRSLWRDEAAIAINIMDRSAGSLFGSLAFAQAAPPGFLLVEKAVTHVFGSGEDALRLLPLLSSLAALVLFALLARRVVGRWTAAVATLLFASAGDLTYYASEVKQYSTDVTATLALLLIGVALYERPRRSAWTTAAFAAVGCAVILTSFAAVFPAVAVVVVLCCREVERRQWRPTPTLVVSAALGLASIAVVLVSRHTTIGVTESFKETSGAYVGSSAHSALTSLREPPSALARDMGILPLPSPLYWLFVLLALVGLVGIARRRLAYACFFVGAGLVMLIASRLHRYPITDRTILYLVPVVALLVAEGVAIVAGLARRAPRGRTAVTVALALAVLAVPGWRALKVLVHPDKHEEIREAIAVVRREWRPGDTLFIGNETDFAVRYYLECGCIDTPAWSFVRTNVGNTHEIDALRSNPPHFIVGQAPLGDLDSYATEVAKLHGRVWLLYSHSRTDTELAFVRQELPRRLAALGTERRSFTAPGVTLYLYDLRAPSAH